ncbi:MAG: zinc ribbon domain-containing protein [Anaerolineales bacterium]
MRDCPNCSQEIQDEAVFCRHCHTELEPPLWLTSMRRCPYCAEWIENDLERCGYCDRTVFASGDEHAAPFVEASSAPADFTQSLRQNLLDEDSDEVAAIAAAAEEFVANDPDVSLAGFDSDQPRESAFSAPPAEGPDPAFYSEPQSDLRRSLYDEPTADEGTHDSTADEQQEPEARDSLYSEPVETPTYYGTSEVDSGSAAPPAPPGGASDSSIWMAGASDEDKEYIGGTGPLSADTDDLGRPTSGTEGVSELRADVSGPPGKLRRAAGKVVRVVIVVAALGAATWGLYMLSQGPVGASISAMLATDVPTETPIPEPTSTRRPAPTLPPVTEEPAILPTGIGTPGFEPDPETGCISWEAITVEDEGTEACVYGVIKRWWAGEDIPFISIFSEEVGTFSIIDRITRHPVGPGSCIMARGTIEIMGGVRPNIDAQGVLEDCPEGVVEG